MMVSGFLLSLLARAMSNEDESGRLIYDTIPDYVKERNMVFMAENGRDYYKVPLPYGYNIFYVMGNIAEELMNGQLTAPQAANRLTMAILGSFMPVSLSEGSTFGRTLLKTVMPTLVKPGWEIYTNENFFGRPIWPERDWDKYTPESERFFPTTRAHFIAISRWLNAVTGGSEVESGYIDISPDKIEHWYEFLTGGLGQFIGNTVDYATRKAKGMEAKPSRTPFLRKIYHEAPEYEIGTTYYELRDIAMAKLYALKKLRGEERRRFRKDNERILRLAYRLQTIEKRLKSLRARRDILLARAKDLAEQERIRRQFQERIRREQAKFVALWDSQFKEP
ncbi:MAG TPA: hypothetical protein ENJ50_09210 [Planctomycetaceae bacterium]|nr:hypothetical protein [Planctomycetaceae bacterium]